MFFVSYNFGGNKEEQSLKSNIIIQKNETRQIATKNYASTKHLLLSFFTVNYCQCEGICGAAYGTCKAGLKCFALCQHCSGETGTNVVEITDQLI